MLSLLCRVNLYLHNFAPDGCTSNDSPPGSTSLKAVSRALAFFICVSVSWRRVRPVCLAGVFNLGTVGLRTRQHTQKKLGYQGDPGKARALHFDAKPLSALKFFQGTPSSRKSSGAQQKPNAHSRWQFSSNATLLIRRAALRHGVGLHLYPTAYPAWGRCAVGSGLGAGWANFTPDILRMARPQRSGDGPQTGMHRRGASRVARVV